MPSERAISLSVLEDIFKNNAYGGIAVSNALAKNKSIDRRSRAFITEIANGTLRNLTLIDYIIAQFSTAPINKIRPVALYILRQSVYEIKFMDTAPYAVCSEAVELAKKRGLAGLSGFVNGVLRNVIRNTDNILLPDEKKDAVKYLSVVYSHPEWIVRKWLGYYGFDFVKQMLKKNNEPPEVTICVNPLKSSVDELAEILSNEGVNVSRPQNEYTVNTLLIKGTGSIKDLRSYKDGLFHVQDQASQIAVSVLSPERGETIIDLCAAPGGKSFYASYLMENKGTVYAGDIHEHKISLIKGGAKRLGIDIINANLRDAAILDRSLIEKADRVIIDAPCTGLGIIRKKPDIKLNRTENDILSIQKLQRNIMRVGAEYVKKGGLILYSTCTVTDEENIDNIKWFLDNFDFELVTPEVNHIHADDVKDGCLRLFPHIHNTDGFFVGLLKKRG